MVRRETGSKPPTIYDPFAVAPNPVSPFTGQPITGGGGGNWATNALAEAGGSSDGSQGFSKTLKGEALNPPFDERMRKMGSPLNRTNKIKRGWIQRADDSADRVNFLFNVPSLQVSSSISTSVPAPVDPNDPPSDNEGEVKGAKVALAGTGTSSGITLLYDRTYEMYSPAKSGDSARTNLAYEYGVFADVAAWYKYFGMIDEMPTSWTNSLLLYPLQQWISYLFVGPKVILYGFPDSLSVNYTHWTEDMIPVRATVSLGFTVLPPLSKTSLYTDEQLAISERENFGNLFGWQDGLFSQLLGSTVGIDIP